MIFLESVNGLQLLLLWVHKRTLRTNVHSPSLKPLKYFSEYLQNPPGELDPMSPFSPCGMSEVEFSICCLCSSQQHYISRVLHCFSSSVLPLKWDLSVSSETLIHLRLTCGYLINVPMILVGRIALERAIFLKSLLGKSFKHWTRW